jgi:hypothetical protein
MIITLLAALFLAIVVVGAFALRRSGQLAQKERNEWRQEHDTWPDW